MPVHRPPLVPLSAVPVFYGWFAGAQQQYWQKVETATGFTLRPAQPMSERLSSVAPPQSAAVPATRTERRQLRRAGISLQIRIRSADFNDGNFDEVRLTQNASRKAIYFFTQLNRYYKGMHVRVTLRTTRALGRRIWSKSEKWCGCSGGTTGTEWRWRYCPACNRRLRSPPTRAHRRNLQARRHRPQRASRQVTAATGRGRRLSRQSKWWRCARDRALRRAPPI